MLSKVKQASSPSITSLSDRGLRSVDSPQTFSSLLSALSPILTTLTLVICILSPARAVADTRICNYTTKTVWISLVTETSSQAVWGDYTGGFSTATRSRGWWDINSYQCKNLPDATYVNFGNSQSLIDDYDTIYNQNGKDIVLGRSAMKRFCQDSEKKFDYDVYHDCSKHAGKIYFKIQNLKNDTCYLSEPLFNVMRKYNYPRDVTEESMTMLMTFLDGTESGYGAGVCFLQN